MNLLGNCSLIRATGGLVLRVGGGMVKLSKAVENRGLLLSMTSKRRVQFLLLCFYSGWRSLT